jgi:cardiolipin synthase
MLAAWHFMLPHLTSLIGVVMGAFLVLRLLGERRATGSTMAWIFAVVLIPYVGVPFYLVFGGRKLKRKAAAKDDLYGTAPAPAVAERLGDDEPIARMLCALGVPPPRAGNHCQLLTTGEQAWTTLLETIDRAERTLHISTLILGADEIGDEVAARLTRRAQAGVEVRLLMDALFMPHSARRRLKPLQQAGGRTASFMPVVNLSLSHHANLRLHRKIVVADDRVAIVGGMNLALEYMGPTPLPSRWHDLSARLVGPAVADIAAIFRADWAFAAEETLASPAPSPVAAGVKSGDDSGARLQVVGSGPDVQSDLLYDAFMSAIFDARRRLWFATPYFVPDEALARAIILAVRRGVDVRILVPAKSDHWIADLAGFSYLREIAAVGGQICAFGPGMMHAKVIIVDDRLGIMGSANLDMRSLFLDYEIALFTSTAAEVKALAAWYESLLPSCGPLAPAGRARALGEDICRLFGPLV